MAVERSYARLGLFIVVALVVILATALLFIQRMRSRAVIEMVTYTTENVSGLDISSPVRYRGVPLGRVSGIRADPVGNTIEIAFEVYRDRLASIGANVPLFEEYSAQAVFPRMRAQVIGNPVTGEAYLLLDAPRDPPPPMAPVAVTLSSWHVESAGSTRLVGAIELTSTQTDRVVHTQVVRLSEPVSAALPGDLAVAAGRLLKRLASEGLKGLTHQR